MLGVGWQGLVRLLTTFLIGRLAGPAVLGVVSAANAVAQITTLLYGAGAGSAASKYLAAARGREDQGEMHGVAALLRQRVLWVSTMLAAGAAGYWYLTEGSAVSAVTVALLAAGLTGWNFVRGVLFGAGQVRRATTLDVVTGALGLIGVLAVLILGLRSPVVLVPVALGYLLFAAMSWPRALSPSPLVELGREVGGFVVLASVGTLGSAGFLQASLLAARAVAGDAAAGHYSAAMALATPMSIMAAGLGVVLFPSLARAWGAGDVPGFRRQTDIATRVLITALIPVTAIVVILRHPIVALVWGEGFEETASFLPFLLTAILVTGMSAPSVSAITTVSQRGMRISATVSVTGAALGILVWLLGSSLGIRIVPVGYLVGVALIAVVPIVLVWRRDRHAWGLLWGRVVLMIAVVAAALPWTSAAPLAWLLPASIVVVAAWGAMSLTDIRAAARVLRRQRQPG